MTQLVNFSVVNMKEDFDTFKEGVKALPVVISLPGCTIDRTSMTINGVSATKRELELAISLAARPNAIVYLEHLYKGIWGEDVVDLNVLAVYVRRLKVKYGLNIINRRGIGYLLAPGADKVTIDDPQLVSDSE